MTAWTAHVTVATVVEKDGKFLFVEEHAEGVTLHKNIKHFHHALFKKHEAFYTLK